MAKRARKFGPKDWTKAYKDYVLQYGELSPDIKSLLNYKEQAFSAFGEYFDGLIELEVHIILEYFQESLRVLKKDKEFSALSNQEQHLSYVYVLIEMISKDELFLKLFQKYKIKDPSFQLHLQKKLNSQDLAWAEINGWKPDFLDELNINPKRSLLLNHALTCMLFYIDDKSKEKQDTDAYIEKSTDLLYRLTDTSTLHSMLDLGKFIFSRSKSKVFA